MESTEKVELHADLSKHVFGKSRENEANTDRKNRFSGGTGAACVCQTVFLFGGDRACAGYFQNLRHGFTDRTDRFYYDELHRNPVLYDVGLLSGGKSEQNKAYAGRRADRHGSRDRNERCDGTGYGIKFWESRAKMHNVCYNQTIRPSLKNRVYHESREDDP